MPPISTLIFLVIIASWGAYLVQHWLRRREYLAMARAVDSYTRVMHVLEHRRPVPQAETRLSRRTFRPVRPAAPQVTVKGATMASTTAAPNNQKPGAPARRPQRSARPARSSRTMRRLRGVSLLASLALVIGLAIATPLTWLPWWAPLLGLCVLGATLIWLVTSARQARAVRRVRRGTGTTVSRGTAEATASRRARKAADEVGTLAATRTVRATIVSDAPAVAAPSTAPATGELFDQRIFELERSEGGGATAVDPAALTEEAPAASAAARADIERPWQPVPVPVPTYALKAPARRPVPAADLPFSSESLDFTEDSDELTPVYDVG